MKEFFISECSQQENKIVTSSFVVASKQVKAKKNGEPYLALTLADCTGQIEAKRRHIGDHLGLRLLEGHQHARLVELRRAAHEEFRPEQRFAAARAAADQSGPSARQAAAGDFIQALDAGGTLGQAPRRTGGFGAVRFHSRRIFINGGGP